MRKILRGTEASMFNFGANLWTLHYLRLTNQIDYTKHFPIFEHLNVELASIMYRFDVNGSFRMWDTSQPSVWLVIFVGVSYNKKNAMIIFLTCSCLNEGMINNNNINIVIIY